MRRWKVTSSLILHPHGLGDIIIYLKPGQIWELISEGPNEVRISRDCVEVDIFRGSFEKHFEPVVKEV